MPACQHAVPPCCWRASAAVSRPRDTVPLVTEDETYAGPIPKELAVDAAMALSLWQHRKPDSNLALLVEAMEQALGMILAWNELEAM